MTARTASQAAAEIVAAMRPLSAEAVPLREALGRVLTGDVTSPVDLPPWHNASMDGYAVRADDVRGASSAHPVMLAVVGTIAAGARGDRPVAPGQAYRIMTGAPLPDGADGVIRVEDTDGGVERVAVVDDRDAGRNVRPRGEDLAAGALAVARGTRLGPAHLGVLASVGRGTVDVSRRPRVAILATGDELVDVDRFDEVRRGERIVTSNSYTLDALVRSAGGEPVPLGLVRDDPDALRACLSAAPPYDLLITSGGISVGAFDHTRRVLADLGAELGFWRVKIRPGAPLGFGHWRGAPWLGLPGNPVSSMVTFELFARPALRRLQGMPRVFAQPVPVRVMDPIATAARLTHFLRAVVSAGADGALEARLTGPQGSGLLTSMAHANALVVVPEDRQAVEPGETLAAVLLDTEALLAGTPPA
ncbi:MAG TPA: gephyrin-like molybdotransferase Glp [Gemmatimonadaceae bacterium]|nr:gephyrin-like molybdotransferase Glp [Gemmatimonadaceae bacterium]